MNIWQRIIVLLWVGLTGFIGYGAAETVVIHLPNGPGPAILISAVAWLTVTATAIGLVIAFSPRRKI